MPFQKEVGVPGKAINSQAREVIANVLRFMKEEATNGITIPVTSYKQRLLKATGISEKTYRSIVKEMELIDAGVINSFRTPKSKETLKQPKTLKIEEVYVDEIMEADNEKKPIVKIEDPTLEEQFIGQ